MTPKKVLLVGNFGVGKTSLIRRFVLNAFSEDYISTIGVRVSSKVVKIDEDEIKLMIWDVAGTSLDEKIPKAYFLGASAAMYVFDLSREETYDNLQNQISGIKELSGLNKIVLVGNKKDLVDAAKIEEIKQSVPLTIDLITSAKENENVESAFIELTQQTLNK